MLTSVLARRRLVSAASAGGASSSSIAAIAGGARSLRRAVCARSVTTRAASAAAQAATAASAAPARGLATAAAAAAMAPTASVAAAVAAVAAPGSGMSVSTTGSDVYDLSESIRLVKAMAVRAFDESVLLNIHLNVDPRKPNQMVRGLAQLPHGSGKQTVVAVFARGERAFEAKQAGADIVGDTDLADKILAGTVTFSRCIATPDMMPVVSKVARILGPKGLMPNPKTGTVTHAVGAAVRSAKQGQVEFKSEKDGSVKAAIGKASFPTDSLAQNIHAFVAAVMAAKPSGAKGAYLKKAYLVGAMTPAVEMDIRAPPFRASSLAAQAQGQAPLQAAAAAPAATAASVAAKPAPKPKA